MQKFFRDGWRPLGRRSWTLGLGLAWVSALWMGYGAMTKYEMTPGSYAAAPSAWPVQSQLPHEASSQTLLVFLHPRCPCSDATLTELEQVLEARPAGLNVQLLYFAPQGADAQWDTTPLITRARKLPHVTVQRDEGGREAEIFHAATSGSTLLFGRQGELRFQGGVTGARGHVGENPGASSLQAHLSGDLPGTSLTPIFGCELRPHDASTCPQCKP